VNGGKRDAGGGIRTHESRERHRLSKRAPMRLRLTRLPVCDSRLPRLELWPGYDS
jgi:hypothetical protein